MAADGQGYTRWSVLGGGEAGCRIASHYFATHPNPAISERIALVNSAKADLTNLMASLRKMLPLGDAQERLVLAEQNSVLLGAKPGAGNWFLVGERILDDNWSDAAPQFAAILGGHADVVVHLCGLGGGTGNGCVPNIIHRLRGGQVQEMKPDIYHFAVGVWPTHDQGDQRQLNALMGLSRLLRYGDRGEPNAHFVLLLGNEELQTLARQRELAGDGAYMAENRIAVEVLDALISPGQESQSVIDATDYAINCERYEIQHFTAGVAWDVPDMLQLEEALNEALENVLMPIDPTTAFSAYVIVQVAPELLEDPAFSVAEVSRASREWMESRGMRVDTRMESVVPLKDLQGTYNVILLLGGFDLGPMVKPHEALVEKHIRVLSRRTTGTEDADVVQANWKRLMDYVEVSNAQRQDLQG